MKLATALACSATQHYPDNMKMERELKKIMCGNITQTAVSAIKLISNIPISSAKSN
jgi:hypothetical protein